MRNDWFWHGDIIDAAATKCYTAQNTSRPETVAWIETFLKEDDIFYDVGANIGAYSLMAAKYHNSNIKVYAFEPGFSNFPQLVKNIVLNGCEESIIPLQVALSNKTIVGTFNYSNLVSGAALHALGEAIDELGRPFKPILRQPVLAYRVDDLVKQFRIPVPNHIKIDVDGAELAVLEGAAETLTDSSVKSIIVEVAEGTEKTAHLVELLVGKGFQLLSRCEDVYGNGNGSGAKVLNYIFQRVLVSTDRAHPAMRL